MFNVYIVNSSGVQRGRNMSACSLLATAAQSVSLSLKDKLLSLHKAVRNRSRRKSQMQLAFDHSLKPVSRQEQQVSSRWQ